MSNRGEAKLWIGKVDAKAWSRQYCINLLRQWSTKTVVFANVRKGRVNRTSVVRVLRVWFPAEGSRRNDPGGVVRQCAGQSPLYRRAVRSLLSSCAIQRRVAIVPSSRHLLCLSATLVRMARLVWTCDVIFLFFRL